MPITTQTDYLRDTDVSILDEANIFYAGLIGQNGNGLKMENVHNWAADVYALTLDTNLNVIFTGTKREVNPGTYLSKMYDLLTQKPGNHILVESFNNLSTSPNDIEWRVASEFNNIPLKTFVIKGEASGIIKGGLALFATILNRRRKDSIMMLDTTEEAISQVYTFIDSLKQQ